MLPIPDFKLNAVSSDRIVTPAALRGMPALLLFHNHVTAGAAQEVQGAVRDRYQAADRPFLASVVDLSAVPRFMRPLASAAMSSGYKQAEKMLPAELSPVDYVVILPDWSGSVTRSFGVDNVGEAPALIYVDDAGMVRDRYQGSALGENALRMLLDQGVAPGLVPGFPER
jgi:hypothetical protein